jgi:hypothetical protein
MRFLNNSKRNLTLTSEVFSYINRYHSIYKKLVLQKKKDILVKSAKYLTKVMWQLNNKHKGKMCISNQDIELKIDSGKIINPQTVADTLNSFYIDWF